MGREVHGIRRGSIQISPDAEALLHKRSATTFSDLYRAAWHTQDMQNSGGQEMQRFVAYAVLSDLVKIGKVIRVGRVVPFYFEARYHAKEIPAICKRQSRMASSRSF